MLEYWCPTDASESIVLCVSFWRWGLVWSCLMQTLQEKGQGVLEQTLVQFLCQYFGDEQPSSALLKQIELEGWDVHA